MVEKIAEGVPENDGHFALSVSVNAYEITRLALMAVGAVADIYIFLGALVTIPVWAPIGLKMENSTAKRKQEAESNAKAALPPSLAVCWTVINSEMEKGGPSNPDQPFVAFDWVPSRENAYVFRTANEVFSDDKPVAIDARVTLLQGCVHFRIEDRGSLWTGADVECGLRAGDVVATWVKLRKCMTNAGHLE